MIPLTPPVRPSLTTTDALLEELDKRYPNDALRIDELKTDKEKTEYIAKLKLIREIKVLSGVKIK